MTPQQLMRLRRIDMMRARLKKPRDQHLEQMRAHQVTLQLHTAIAEGIGIRQADTLDAIKNAIESAASGAWTPQALDAARYRWLLEDHSDPATRETCRELLRRLPLMSYSAASAAIDAAMAKDAAIGGAR